MSAPSLRLVFLAYADPGDAAAKSGRTYHMARALREAWPGLRVVHLRRPWWFAPTQWVADRVRRGDRWLLEREPLYARAVVRPAERSDVLAEADVILSDDVLAVAELNGGRPVVLWDDATFAGLLDYHPAFTGLCRRTRTAGDRLARRALTRCSLAAYSSAWAADTAVRSYGIAADGVCVLHFGAALEPVPDRAEALAAVQNRSRDVCRLLFVGRDWQSKGGDIAVRTAVRLAGEGLPCELSLVGSSPPDSSRLPAGVRCHGFLDPNSAAARARYRDLLAAAHFLVLPTQVDCSPKVVAEANAFGVPAVVRDTGGTGSLMAGSHNGRLMPPAAAEAEYADVIRQAWSDPVRYRRLCLASRRGFETRLNWSTSVERLLKMVRALASSDARQLP
jgi:glycosyltransferase involved in cell wall biosynthesis